MYAVFWRSEQDLHNTMWARNLKNTAINMELYKNTNQSIIRKLKHWN